MQHDIDGCDPTVLTAPPATREHGFYGPLLADLCVGVVEGNAAAGPAAKRALLAHAEGQLAGHLSRRVGDLARDSEACSTFGLRGLHRLLVEVRDLDAEAVLFAVLSHVKPSLCGFGRGVALERPRSFYVHLANTRRHSPPRPGQRSTRCSTSFWTPNTPERCARSSS